MELTDIGAALVMLFVISCFIYAVVPPHWQSPLGFLIIMCCGMPAGLLILAALAQPAILIPAAFVLGVLAIGRTRARG